GVERVGGDGFQSSAQPGKDQHGHSPARAAARKAIELSNELGGSQPGHAAHLHHRSAPAGIHTLLLRGNCPGCGADVATARVSRDHFVFRGGSGTRSERSGFLPGPASGWTHYRYSPTRPLPGFVPANSTTGRTLCLDGSPLGWTARILCRRG